MFTVTEAQLAKTNLLIQLYDKDAADNDDFLGEVVVNLGGISGILSGTVNQTYQIRPQVSIHLKN